MVASQQTPGPVADVVGRQNQPVASARLLKEGLGVIKRRAALQPYVGKSFYPGTGFPGEIGAQDRVKFLVARVVSQRVFQVSLSKKSPKCGGCEGTAILCKVLGSALCESHTDSLG